MSQIRQSFSDPTVIEVIDQEKLDQNKDAVIQGPSMSRCKILIIFWAGIIVLLTIAGIIIVILFAAKPCVFARCHANAYCKSRPFYAKCACKSGFYGNGRDYCDECGLTYNAQNLKIVGGVPAVAHSWPSAAFIVSSYQAIAKPTENQSVPVSAGYSCGGTLIDRRWVLTAGHCIIKSISYSFNDSYYSAEAEPNVFFPTAGSMYKVYLGAHQTIFEETDISPARPYAVDQVVLHENYDEDNILNDIALLRLSQPVELDTNMQIACLPDQGVQVYPNETGIPAWVIGWGVEKEDGWGTEQLNNVKITIYGSEMCKNVSDSVKNWDSQICAGEYQGGKDSCQGDSGGSLFVRDKIYGKEKYISVGVVSYGIGCARKGLPGIYTRVSYYSDWIEKTKNRYEP